jgi:hypothetical protein
MSIVILSVQTVTYTLMEELICGNGSERFQITNWQLIWSRTPTKPKLLPRLTRSCGPWLRPGDLSDVVLAYQRRHFEQSHHGIGTNEFEASVKLNRGGLPRNVSIMYTSAPTLRHGFDSWYSRWYQRAWSYAGPCQRYREEPRHAIIFMTTAGH